MTSRTITINAYPLNEYNPSHYTISLSLTEKTPSKACPINDVTDCKRALADFAAELKPTGKPWHLSVSFNKKSGRKPPGFDKAYEARELQCHVNEHLAPQRAA
jgi:hypothetical protein